LKRKLLELKELLDEGWINEANYDKKKSEVLDKM